MHDEVFTLDLGPEFTGWSGVVEGKIVCIVPPTVFRQESVQHTARSLMQRVGAVVSGCPCHRNTRDGSLEIAA